MDGFKTPTNGSHGFSGDISQYDLQGLVGFGSFGRVYKASCKSNHNSTCAIKCISKKAKRDSSKPAPPLNINKILSEVSIHLRLKHENILRLYEVIEDEKYVYLVLEYCSGGSLGAYVKKKLEAKDSPTKSLEALLENRSAHSQSDNQLLKQLKHIQLGTPRSKASNSKSGPIQPVLCYAAIRSIINQISTGLSYLHRNSIVHRDLNLNNLLLVSPCVDESLEPRMRIKLADFGLAIDLKTQVNLREKKLQFSSGKFTGSASGNTICGTPGYICPEIWTQSESASAASDLFSVGSIVYALIAGETPKGDLDLSRFPPLATDLITKLLAPKPDDRLTLPQLKSHPFVFGPLDVSRLAPISKKTKSMQLEITAKPPKAVKVIFTKNGSSIVVSNSGNSINFGSKSFTLETLPPSCWKRYVYVCRFVELVKAKTPKITFHPQLGDERACRFESKGVPYAILKAILMENGDFEATLKSDNPSSNPIKIVYGKPNANDNLFDENCYSQLKWLYNYCSTIESQLESISSSCGDLVQTFPVVLGRRNATLTQHDNANTTTRPKSGHLSNRLISPPHVSANCMTNHPRTISTLVGGSALSQAIRSVHLKGIGQASQQGDGIQVQFLDGTSISVSSNSQIIYAPKAGSEIRFSKRERIPEYVVNKLSVLPQAIDELRRQASSSILSNTSARRTLNR